MLNRLKLDPADDGPFLSPISPYRELGAYEALWLEQGSTFKRLADRFKSDTSALPSDFISEDLAVRSAEQVMKRLAETNVTRFGVRINKAGDYPEKLRDARHPIELLYYQGTWELSEERCVAVVGSRKASDEGKRRAARIARELVKEGFVVVSGLATGIDTAALTAALEAGGNVIAVIGTPIGEYYPKENVELQNEIATNHLLISQVPILKYQEQPFPQKRTYFPERNATMSALTEGTIIVEAGETSGTLTQARAALFQGRKLFILDSCFKNKAINWPERFQKEGAVRVAEPKDIFGELQ